MWPWGEPTPTQWNDWLWQLRNRIHRLDQFLPLIPEKLRPRACEGATAAFPFSVTPYFAKLIATQGPSSEALARLVLPTAEELIPFEGQLSDPTGEEGITQAPGLRHMYPDRVLYTLTYICPAYCRHCFRRRIVGSEEGLPYDEIEKGLQYIRRTPGIREVILSGGEPLLLSDAKLRRFLADLSGIPHIEVVRIHTKVPLFLPQRITPSLIEVLKTFRPVYIIVNVAHPAELSPETREALNRLADNGFPLGSQTPLLAGINDSSDTIKTLMLELLRERVRPYYLHHCIPVAGSLHFRTSVETGVKILEGLRGHISGLAVPTLSVFLSEAGGKVSVAPQYLAGREEGSLVFQNYQGKLYRYPASAE